MALDIAKNKHDALILLPSGKRLSMTVANSLEGYQPQLNLRPGEAVSMAITFDPLEVRTFSWTVYDVTNPRCWRYSIGLRRPNESLIRPSLYQRM